MSPAVLVFLTLLAGIVVLAITASLAIASRSMRGEEIVPYEPRRPVPWRIIDVLVVVSLWIVLQAVAAEAVHRLLDLPPDAPLETRAQAIVPKLAADSISKIAGLVLGIAWLKIAAGATWRDLGLDFSRFGDDVRLGVLAFGVIVVPVYAIQTLLTVWFKYEHPVMEMMKSRPDAVTYVCAGVAAVIVAPIVEEFIFRVVLQGWLEAHSLRVANKRLQFAASAGDSQMPDSQMRWTTVPHEDAANLARPGAGPIVITSLVFALMHFEQGPSPVPLFVLALVLGYVYRQTHRIVPSVVVHAMLNACSLVLFLLSMG
jgi:membrane protease YdiL (CAAX protease family)